MLFFIEVSLIIFVTLLSLSLGILVFMRNPKNTINKVYLLIGISFFLWSLSLLLYQVPLILDSLFWIRATYMLSVAFMVTDLWFSFVFPKMVFKRAWIFATLYAVLYIWYSIWLMFFTKLWVIDVVIDPNKGLQTILGPGYVYWIIATWVIFIWAAVNFIIKGKKASGLEKLQLRYFWIGFILFGFVFTLTDGIIPLVFNDTGYFFISAINPLVFSGPIAYVILRHRLFDIRLIIIRSFGYSILVLFLASIYALGLYLTGVFLTHQSITFVNLIISAALMLLIIFSFQFLQRMFQRITDSLFFKGRYNPQNLLGAIGKIIASNIDLSYVSDSVMKEISEQMKISSVILFLCKDKSVFSAKAIGSIKDSGINDGGKLYELIESIVRAPGENILVKDELSESDIKEMMASRRCSILLPLIVQDEIVGAIFLGDKSSGEAYSMEDIELLKILAPQVAVALKNSYLYEQVKEFNLNLQEKIDKATKELVDANKRLMSLDKLKDEFVSIASHELRSPMTIIQGYAWRILYDKNETLSAKNKERVERVYASTQRLIALVNDILDVSRIESGTMLFNNTNFNIAKLAEEIKKEISDSYSKKDLKVSVQNKNVYNVSADRDKIHQVIFNLMDNAIKFTPDGGKIDILFSQDGNYISTTISDSGIGIKESDIGNLFTKFTRLDNSLSPSYRTKGTGLGLYLSKKIVDKSQGTISVTSKFGQGSKFTFTLPKA